MLSKSEAQRLVEYLGVGMTDPAESRIVAAYSSRTSSPAVMDAGNSALKNLLDDHQFAIRIGDHDGAQFKQLSIPQATRHGLHLDAHWLLQTVPAIYPFGFRMIIFFALVSPDFETRSSTPPSRMLTHMREIFGLDGFIEPSLESMLECIAQSYSTTTTTTTITTHSTATDVHAHHMEDVKLTSDKTSVVVDPHAPSETVLWNATRRAKWRIKCIIAFVGVILLLTVILPIVISVI